MPPSLLELRGPILYPPSCSLWCLLPIATQHRHAHEPRPWIPPQHSCLNVATPAGIAYLNAAVVPRIARVSTQLPAASSDAGLMEAACQDSQHQEAADDGIVLAHHFLAFELQDGVVMRAAHTWVHVPEGESGSFDLQAPPAVANHPDCQPRVVSVQPLLRTTSSQQGAARRQVFHAHDGEWGPEVMLHK